MIKVTEGETAEEISERINDLVADGWKLETSDIYGGSIRLRQMPHGRFAQGATTYENYFAVLYRNE